MNWMTKLNGPVPFVDPAVIKAEQDAQSTLGYLNYQVHRGLRGGLRALRSRLQATIDRELRASSALDEVEEGVAQVVDARELRAMPGVKIRQAAAFWPVPA